MTDAAGQLTVLQGKALEQKPPERIRISGDINTINSFLSVRKKEGAGLQFIDKSQAIVTVDKAKLSILLQLKPSDHYGAEVEGKLELSDELKSFHINQNKTFSKEELVKLLKFSKIHFDDAGKHADLLLAFQKVSSIVNIKANESSDDRGNKERAFVKDVTTNAPTEFILKVPVFKGFPPLRFRVEICLDVTEGSVRFWFESVELHEMIQSQLDAHLEDALKEAEGFVIIRK